MSEHQNDLNPGGAPPADDRNEEIQESPIPDPEAKQPGSADDPQAD